MVAGSEDTPVLRSSPFKLADFTKNSDFLKFSKMAKNVNTSPYTLGIGAQWCLQMVFFGVNWVR